MNDFRLGVNATRQLTALAQSWEQGQHVLVTGGTGCGKTTLARYLDEIRLQKGGSVIVFIAKLRADDTISTHYKGWVRWKEWKPARKRTLRDRQVLLWPDVEGKAYDVAMNEMRRVFGIALREISREGRWTVHIDEGGMLTDPAFIGLGKPLGMMYALMRTSKATMITLAQRPSHLPVGIYANLSHAFVSYAREVSDLQRLAHLDGGVDSKDLKRLIGENEQYDFTWINATGRSKPQKLNLTH